LYPDAVRVLVAPDKFKGTLTAEGAGQAIAAGWLRAAPDAEIEVVPIADGGEGTLEALTAALHGERRRARVTGPLGSPRDAEYALVEAAGELLGVVEMARASGLALVSAARRDPLRASTRGTGELILAACRDRAERVMVCIGGSATNDGGAGMAQALGIRLLDTQGRDIKPGGAALLDLATIDLRPLDPAVKRASFVAATDVDNPLVGPHGASAVYGPQKGASPADILLLDRALAHLAAVIHRDLGIDVRDTPGAGAAGGLGAGLMAFLGAKLRPGADVVLEAVGLRRRLEAADVLVTGEGRFDEQSLRGKAPAAALRMAAEIGVPAAVLCGQRTIDVPGVVILSLADRFGMRASMSRARPLLEELAADAARMVSPKDRA
jgi:glycerate kinase